MRNKNRLREEINLPIGKRLESLMSVKKITNQQLAEMIGMSEQTVTRIKRGEADITVSLVETLARALGVSRDVLLGTGTTPTDEVPAVGSSGDDYSIFRGLRKVSDTFLSITPETLSGCDEKILLCDVLPKEIERVCGLDTTLYKTAGSIGKGNRAEVPWIATFYTKLTTSAQHGVYIVLLYKADMSGVYLTLNQGITKYEDIFKRKKGRIEAAKMARRLQTAVPKPDGFSRDAIDLVANGHFGRGYEAACIFQRRYDFADPLPSNSEFAQHFNELLRAYESVIDIIGQRTADDYILYELAAADDDTILDESEDADVSTDDLRSAAATEASVQLELPGYNPDDVHPEKKPELVTTKSGRKIHPRKASVVLAAVGREIHNGCELCGKKPFISAKTKLPYYECHHLVPLSRHPQFEVSLDVVANVSVLCPECHRMLHHGLGEVKREALTKLYNKHSNDLNRSGIHITLEELSKMYGC